jgi:hypothetical protein
MVDPLTDTDAGYPPTGHDYNPHEVGSVLWAQQQERNAADRTEGRPAYYRRPTKSALRRRSLERQIRQAQTELAKLDQFPEQDPHQDGVILRVTVRHDIDAGQTPAYFIYIAAKFNSLWYTTGRTGPHKADWSRFVGWLADRAETVEQIHPRLSSEGVEWIEPIVRRYFDMRTHEAGVAFRLIGELKDAALDPGLVGEHRGPGTSQRDPGFYGYDKAYAGRVRAHLHARHHNLSAAAMSDQEAVAQHQHEHAGPGTMHHDHDSGDLSLHVEVIEAQEETP